MPARAHALLQALREALGGEHVLTEGDLRAWTIDWRRRYEGRPLAVVRPADTAQVAAVVRACAAHGHAIVPQGGNTGLVGGGVPDASGRQVLLSLQRMQALRRIDAANLTLVAEAGCPLQSVQQAAADAGLLFPLSLASEGSCTVGGNLATNAGGTQVLRYGNARELCLGLEVVGADGEVWSDLQGLRKDNTGYALRDLFIGSEGTLGVITAASLRLFPSPRSLQTALAVCPDVQAAVHLLQLAQSRLGAGLSGFEIMAQEALALTARHFPELAQGLPPGPWSVLLELSDAREEQRACDDLQALLGEALEAGLLSDAVLSASLQQSGRLWQLREAIPLAQSREGLNVKHDISLPISEIPGFVRAAEEALLGAWPGVRLITFGHLGDGNLHYNVQAPVGHDAAAFLRDHESAIQECVYDLVQARGGSFSAEHGIGALKRETLAQRKSPQALKLMRAIKQALDPQGLFNPGRVL